MVHAYCQGKNGKGFAYIAISAHEEFEDPDKWNIKLVCKQKGIEKICQNDAPDSDDLYVAELSTANAPAQFCEHCADETGTLCQRGTVCSAPPRFILLSVEYQRFTRGLYAKLLKLASLCGLT